MQRATASPYAGSAPMVDKLIGNAYDTVKTVADKLSLLQYLADNMEALVLIANDLGITSNDLSITSNDLSITSTVLGIAGQPGETTQLALPAGVAQDSITSTSVLLDDGVGGLYGFESNYFTFYILNGSLRLTMNPLAPPALAGASVRWSISYKV